MVELAVLVPVLNRPQNVAPLVESFLAGCPDDSELWFLVQRGDLSQHMAVEDILERDERIWEGRTEDATTWPQKINWGVRHADADWYLFAADDITFVPGWWEATAELRADPAVGVIGTNDSATGQGNAAVAEGTHTCHPLVRASYIRELGTWDGPGQAVSDEYHHWYVDNELVITAKMRRAWAMCPEAIVEHIHPYWKPNEAEWDATYALGESRAEEDKQTWFRRAALFGPLQPPPLPDE